VSETTEWARSTVVAISGPVVPRVTLILTQRQRDALYRVGARLLDSEFAEVCEDLEAIRSKRQRLRRLFHLVDQIGWQPDETRDAWQVTTEAGWLRESLMSSRDEWLDALAYDQAQVAFARAGDTAYLIHGDLETTEQQTSLEMDRWLEAVHGCDEILSAIEVDWSNRRP
jgi:hypothetical protein